MKNTISLPVNDTASKAADTPAPQTPAAASAETSGKSVKRDPLMENMPPSIRKVLEKRQAAKAADPSKTPPAAEMPAQKAGDTAATARNASHSDAGGPPAKPDKPAADARPGSDVKTDDAPDAGVIDFKELEKGDKPAGTEDDAPTALTEAELKDLTVVQKKLDSAFKDNAKLREKNRKEREAKEKLEGDNKALTEQLTAAQAQAQQPQTGSYLDRFTDAKGVQAAREDAMAVLRQLREDPELETFQLPHGGAWKMKDEEARASAAETALEILGGYDVKMKQLTERGDAEKLVAEKLPVLSKLVPDFEKRYKAALDSDWHANAPKLSLNAALGELVTSGDYILRPRDKEAPKTPPKKVETEALNDLSSTPPPARPVNGGEVDLGAVRKKALAGDEKAMSEWIRLGGKKQKAA